MLHSKKFNVYFGLSKDYALKVSWKQNLKNYLVGTLKRFRDSMMTIVLYMVMMIVLMVVITGGVMVKCWCGYVW